MDCSGNNTPLEYIIIGKIIGGFGKSGAVKIRVLTDFPERFFSGEDVFLFTEDKAEPQKIKLTESFHHKNFIVAKISACTSMEDAKRLTGAYLKILSSQLKKLDKNRYYQFQIINLPAYDENNNYIGRVKDIIENPCNDIYVIFNETSKNEILIPAIGRYVKKVDLENEKITITVPEYTE